MDYLDNRGRTDSPGLTFYYKKGSLFYYLALVLILPILSWFVLAPSVNIQLVPWYAMFAGIFSYISYGEHKGLPEENTRQKNRKKDPNIYRVFQPLVFCIDCDDLCDYCNNHADQSFWLGNSTLVILLLSVFCGVFYIFARMHLFGGADAWALIFISFCLPTFPFTPLLGNPPLGFLSFSVLINALLLNLVAPIGIFITNIIRRNRAPLMYMFFGFPVNGEKIQNEWGFVMEDFEERKGIVSQEIRRLLGFH